MAWSLYDYLQALVFLWCLFWAVKVVQKHLRRRSNLCSRFLIVDFYSSTPAVLRKDLLYYSCGWRFGGNGVWSDSCRQEDFPALLFDAGRHALLWVFVSLICVDEIYPKHFNSHLSRFYRFLCLLQGFWTPWTLCSLLEQELSCGPVFFLSVLFAWSCWWWRGAVKVYTDPPRFTLTWKELQIKQTSATTYKSHWV